jgi:L-histidine Nalpha-methyltransferase
MASLVNIAVHPGQFPARVRRDLVQSLLARQVNHKFHYDSIKQTQKWLALHAAFSPSRTDPHCAETYDRGFDRAAAALDAPRIHVIGLGCGGGQKDTRLLQLLKARGREIFYTPCDVSTAMVLVAQQTAAAVVPDQHCFPLVCDLATADDLPEVLDQIAPRDAARLITFFGMLPNFEPSLIMPRLAAVVRNGDILLLSANLAPGPDYAEGVQRILPLYDNDLTGDWLMALLIDLGVERDDGEVCFAIEEESAGHGLKRVTAYFDFSRERTIRLDDEEFRFSPGDSIRLFFSYRHTPSRVRAALEPHALRVLQEWIAPSGEEGVFLIRR